MNRRSFFQMIAGALASLGLPWKSEAMPTEELPTTATGLSLLQPQVHWVKMEVHYCLDGIGSVTLFSLGSESIPFYAHYDKDDFAPQFFGVGDFGSDIVPVTRYTHEVPIDEWFKARYPDAVQALWNRMRNL